MAISDTKLRSLYGKPYSGPTEITDSDGLSVRITPKGVINFQYRYRWDGKQHRLGIGKYPAVTLRDARNVVADLKMSLDKGMNPKHALTSGLTSGATVSDCIEYWQKTYVNVSLRDKTRTLYESTIVKHISGAFPGVPIEHIPVKSWIALFEGYEKQNQRMARQLLVQLKSAINWCIRRRFIDRCSVMEISPKDVGIKPSVGEVTLSYNQIAKIWLAIERSRASTANKLVHQLLILYGARNSEVREAVNTEFDRDEGMWIIPAERSKNKKIIRRPIFKHAELLIDKAAMAYGNVLFPGPDLKTPMTIAGANRFLGRIQKSLDIGGFTAHDFRRTLATRLSEDGVAPHVIEKMLGHELGGVLSVYNKHDWIEDQKNAYELYAEKIFFHIKKLSG